jgi:beta-propeller repeat-containing protein/flagellar hook capping protein FlgD
MLVAVSVGRARPASAADMVWSTFLGGSGSDSPYRVATDSNGDIFVTGTTDSPNYPVSAGAFQSTLKGGQDVFLTKLKGDGTSLLWSTYLGGTSTDNALALAVDGNGNVYVGGVTSSTDLPVTGGAFRRTYSGGGDGFVAKFTSSGALSYLTYLGGYSDDAVYDLAVDGNGNAIAVGASGSVDFPITSGVVKGILRDSEDGYVTKLNANGSGLVYSTFLGSDGGTDIAYGVAVDGQGQATVTGWTNSPAFPVTAGVFGPAYRAFSDGFVTRLNATASAYVYSTYIPGSGYDEPWTVAVDGNGNAYVAGRTASPDFPTTSGGYQRSKGGGTWDGFVVKISPDARSLTYGTYLGGGGDDYVYGLRVNTAGEACLAGYTMSTNFPVTGNASDQSANGGADSFVSRLNATGGLAYSSYLGGAAGDYGLGIGLQPSGQLVVSGSTASTGFPVTTGTYDQSFGGTTDGFVTLLAGGTQGAVGVVDPSKAIELSAPRPNPFRGVTAFGCTLTSGGVISIRIVDLQGRVVRSLAEGWHPAGRYDWIWDGRDQSGRDLGAGLYLLEAVISDRRSVRQLVRLR